MMTSYVRKREKRGKCISDRDREREREKRKIDDNEIE